jgi:hypothetical protein
MIGNKFGARYLPACLWRQPDDSYMVLNRGQLPVGIDSPTPVFPDRLPQGLSVTVKF